jgi:cation transport regulator
MPYSTIGDLPDAVRNHLPKHAQEIFLKAFNNALEEYKTPSKRNDKKSSPEEVAFKVAWAAVKKKYKKSGDKWVGK